MNAMLRCVLVCAMVSCVVGHAVLVSPTPLNTNPTTAQKCGVSTYPANPVPVVTWRAGSTVTLVWNLVAGDGGKLVYGQIDPQGGTNFTVTAWSTPFSTDQGAGKQYPLAFTVPAVACPKGYCMLRLFTETNWNSCSYVNISSCDDCPLPTPAPPVCRQTNNVNFCNSRSQSAAMVAADSTVAAVDADTKTFYFASLNNTNVFTNGTYPQCQTDFKKYVCLQNLPPCAGSDGKAAGSVCRGQCRTTMSECGLTEIHKALFPCDDLELCDGESDSSSASLTSSLFAAAAVLAAVALL